jgi:hypothetical protein
VLGTPLANLLLYKAKEIGYYKMHTSLYFTKCKAIPVQGWTDPKGSSGLRVPDFKIIGKSAHEGGKVVSRTHWPLLPPRKDNWYSFFVEAESTPRPKCGRKDYVNEKFQ